MYKIPVILQPDEFTSFTCFYLESLWNKFFDVQVYDQTKNYDKKHSIFVLWYTRADDLYCQQLKNQGYKVVIDNLWELPSGRSDYHWMENLKWWWWNESLWWRALGFNIYQPKKDLRYLALMQLRRQTPERLEIKSRLSDLLPRILYSCSWTDSRLPHDDYESLDWQRFMHPSWYDMTFCSLAIEGILKGPRFYVTEKSFKPLAYYHPALWIGQSGTLAHIRSLDFETFENLFDESYDKIESLSDRLELILTNLYAIDRQSINGYDSFTTEKLRHNHELFFSEDRCRCGIEREIIKPLLEYAEA